MADYVHRCGRTGRLGHSQNCSILSLIAYKSDVSLVQQIETAARKRTDLPNVNNNIAKILYYRHLKHENNEETDGKCNKKQGGRKISRIRKDKSFEDDEMQEAESYPDDVEFEPELENSFEKV